MKVFKIRGKVVSSDTKQDIKAVIPGRQIVAVRE